MNVGSEVAEGVFRLGAELVNWFVIEDKGKITLVDAGAPTQYDQLPETLLSLGHTLDDVEAVVLTHAHGDHLGSAERIRKESDSPIHVHRGDVALARGEAEREHERHWARDLIHPFAWRTAAFFLRAGVTNVPPLHELAEFDHGESLDIPGSPRVIHTPGHTDGSSCIELAGRKALFTGDALVTLNIATGDRTPRVMPGSFNKNSELALASLNELRGSPAEVILPGHGEPLHSTVDAAVDLAQTNGAS